MDSRDSAEVAKAIVAALNKAVSTMGSGKSAVPGGREPISAKRGSKIDEQKQRKSILATSAALGTLEDSAKDSAKQLDQFSKKVHRSATGLDRFGGSLGKTIQQLSSTRSQFSRIDFNTFSDNLTKAVTNAIGSAKDPSDSPKTTASAAAAALDEAIKQQVNPRLGLFRKAISLTTRTLIGFARDVQGLKVPETDESKTKVKKDKKKKKPEADDPVEPKSTGKKRVRTPRERSQEKKRSEIAETAIAGFSKALSGLKMGGIEMVDDAFQVLAARGYGTTDSLFTLYKAAITTGMRLQDYAKFIDENMIVVSRSSSFADFQGKIAYASDSLAKFGVFGDDAAKLAGTMMSASIELGVPQDQMLEALDRQIDSFAKLRKTTNVTADEFAQLTKRVSEDSQVRTELSALEPGDRLRRQQEITDQTLYARSLNLSAAAQQSYTQAVLEQRKTTVKSRFQQAGRLTQAAGLLGLDPTKVQQLQALSKNKYKTDDEQKLYMSLLGEVNTGLERMQQSGQPGSQFQSDTMREFLSSAGLQTDLDAAAAIRAGKQSGDVKNKDIGKELSPAEQTAGKLITYFDGFMKNPFGSAMVTIGSTVATTLTALLTAQITIGSVLSSKLDQLILAFKAGGITQKTGVDIPSAEGSAEAGKKGRFGKIGSFLGKHAGKLFGAAAIGLGAYEAYKGVSNAEETAKPENGGDGDVGKVKGEAVGEGLGSAIGGTIASALTLALAPLTGGLSVLASGIAGVAGAWAGGLLGKFVGGLVGAESATEKNTRETQKQTEEIIKARRAGMPENIVNSSNLGTLGANVLASAKAATTPTAAEVQKAREANMTPEQRKAAQAATAAAAGTTVTVPVYDAMGNQTGFDTQIAKPSPAKPTSMVATPVTTPPKNVTSGTVNTPESDAQGTTSTSKTSTSSTSPSQTTDAATLLAQILAVLQQSLSAENKQVDLAAQLLRVQALLPSLPDNQKMVRKVLDQ